MSDYVFVTASYDWSDEFNCDCIFCGSTENWEKLVAAIKKWFDDHPEESKEIYFGTNENLDFSRLTDIIKTHRNFNIEPILFNEYQRLKKMFNESDNENGFFIFGTGSGVFDISNWESQEE